MNRIDRHSQSGNMFIYIIGAIFLIGLLVVIMRGGFQPGSGIDGEKAVLQATKIRQYASQLEAGVSRVLSNGHSETEIRFAHANADAGYGTPGDIPSRQVFDPEGGAVEWQDVPAGIQTTATPWTISALSAVDGVGTTCSQASCTELTAYLMYIHKDLCLALNNSIGITNPLGNPPADVDGYNWLNTFNGTFSASSAMINTTGDHTKGRLEGCVGVGSEYHYYRVLLAR